MHLETAEVRSPCGIWSLAASPQGLVLLHFTADWDEVGRALHRRFGTVSFADAEDPREAVSRLHAYFGGDLRALEGIPVDTGGTPFQQEVWAALRRIPAGRTSCYSELAARIGRPSATRAVGAANGANPVAVVIPCHRVIGRDGSLTGYGGGLERKAWLLRHEGVIF
jgi:methylated-DNA-[protein]-cysteine S-methyltransferase